MKTKLNDSALEVLEKYFNIKIGQKTIICPYFNNRKRGQKAELRALAGKGTPEEIETEAKISALKKKIDLVEISKKDLQKFLVESGIGIDCSGFVYHVLDKQLRSEKKKGLRSFLDFSSSKSFFGKIKAKFRPAQNADVRVFASDKNSSQISSDNTQAGDFIAMLGEKDETLNHIILIYKTEEMKGEKTFFYAHSIAWPSDGQYDHGVKKGKIILKNKNKDLMSQKWVEDSSAGEDVLKNLGLKGYKNLELRRLKI